jgi:thymidylate synthase (FAD)
MKIIKQGFELLYPQCNAEWLRELKLIESAGRTAYRSENLITDDSALPFIQKIVGRGHLAVIEFGDMIVRFITDRGITHEIVRHRLCSFVQESTRYCNYSKGKFNNEVTFIVPSGIDTGSLEGRCWVSACAGTEDHYFSLLNDGYTPQQARSVLPSCTKAEIVVKANFREWRHIFSLRAISKAAHPDMRALMIPLYEKCRELCPKIFDMGDPENGGVE